ncbi:MAG TPA: C25 family cysteine peptidase, partial [Bacteroidales bacterium]|nr:C25 family cysteine peptidase [Bacteroidales bacterium]
MIRPFILLLVLLFFHTAFHGHAKVANQGVQLHSITRDSGNDLHFTLEVETPSFEQVKSPAGAFLRINVTGLFPDGVPGSPELPVYQSLTEIPEGADVHVSWEVLETKEFDLASTYPGLRVYPYQGPLCKHPDSTARFRYTPSSYALEQGASEVVVLEDHGTMRSRRLGMVQVHPFRYDPVSGLLIQITRIRVHIRFTGTLSGSAGEGKCSPMFALPEGMLLGGSLKSGATDNLSRYPLSYVIVSDPMFRDSLQSFIAWKEKKGFRVIEAYTDDPLVGATTTSIRNYLLGLYQNATASDPAPTYLLIVGDIAQVPAFNGTTGSHVTDLNYAEYTGDNLPELYYGRFSATSIAELMPQIRKTLMYEKYLMPDPSYLDEVVMIGGVDSYYGPTHANGQINYGTTYYFNASHGLTSHTYLYPASGSADALIRADVSNGVSYANYTAHGGTGGWSDPTFNTTHVPLMTNAGKYPLMVGNACLTNSFQVASCFGEALLRADNKGAIGYIGASNNTYWNEDFWWGVGLGTISANPTYAGTGLGAYDRLWHDHGEPYSDWYVTQGQMIHAGNLAVEASTTSLKKYYWEVYHLMGDPSLMIYMGQAPLMAVTLPALVQPTATTVNVQTVPYALVALSRGGVLHGSALADSSGLAVVQMTPFMSPGPAEAVVTAQDRQPWFGTFQVTAPAGPYPVVDRLLASETTGNGNAQPDAGETLSLAAVVTNAGNALADTFSLRMTCNDTYVSMVKGAAVMTGLGAGVTDTLLSAFSLMLSPSTPDQHSVFYTVEAITDTDTLLYNLQMIVNAPALRIYGEAWSEVSGNGNAQPDPGENLLLHLAIGNTGHTDASGISVLLSALTPFVVVPDSGTLMGGLAVSQIDTLVLPVFVPAACPQGFPLRILVEAFSGGSPILSDTLDVKAGKAPVAVIDLDGNSSSAPAIIASIRANGFSVDELSDFPADLSPYTAVFVCLGIYSDNHQLDTGEGQLLAAYLNAGGRLYIEGGDAWYYDPQTAVHPMFNIDGLSDGSADLATLGGVASSFTQGLSFVYSGEENWIDHIAPLGSAFSIFQNSSPVYTAAVAYDAGTYRTIGCSFEFSGLSNANSPSTRDELMTRYLAFFGLINQPLSPGFTPGNTSLCLGDTLVFSDTTSPVPVACFWRFPGGTPSWSVQSSPQVSFPQSGSYPVSLYVTNGANVFEAQQQTIITVASPVVVGTHPVADTVLEGDTAEFYANGQNMASCAWERSSDGGSSWFGLIDGPVFQGCTTPYLKVCFADSSMSGDLLRLRLTGICPQEEVTLAAMLTVLPLPVDCYGIGGLAYYDNAQAR